MVGASRVNAQVAADIDYSETEEAREQYGPDPAKVRSEQISEDTQRGAKTAAGVPGATSNTPPEQSTKPKLNELAGSGARSAERRGGKEGVITCSTGWGPYTKKKNNQIRKI